MCNHTIPMSNAPSPQSLESLNTTLTPAASAFERMYAAERSDDVRTFALLVGDLHDAQYPHQIDTLYSDYAAYCEQRSDILTLRRIVELSLAGVVLV
jgi:hypothetical protein